MAISCPVQPQLFPQPDADFRNTQNIEAILHAAGGGHVRIPKGTYYVNPITLKSNCRITGCGIGLSRLVFSPSSPPTNASDQHVLATEPIPLSTTGHIRNVMVSDITLDGNRSGVAGKSYFHPPYWRGHAEYYDHFPWWIGVHCH